MNVIYWEINEHSNNLKGMENSNLELSIDYALRFVKTYESIISKIQFSEECQIKGEGIELGAGFGVMSSVLSKLENVGKITCIEYSKNLLENIMPLIFQRLEANIEKIERIRGSFNHLEFNNNTFDFAIETLAFHHADAPYKPISEAYRVLRRGGVLIMIERAVSNRTTDDTIETSLNTHLGKRHLLRYNFPVDMKITRAEWGEHDLRFIDWMYILNKVGFEVKLFKSFYLKKRILNKLFKSFYKLSGIGDLIFKKQLTYFPLYDYYSVSRRAGNAIFICKKL
ncbi:MAG: class I SAM-dependent methyltransferase [Candidatus Omnitrophica bacterium]|nr:class I SAM-dependent methyltransferase [Candidatus Omnitrophota bacterium]